MAITKRPAKPASVEAFIQGAPDGAAIQAGQGRAEADEGKGVQITLRINKAQLDRIIAVAKRQGIPRASYIKRAIALQLEADNKS